VGCKEAVIVAALKRSADEHRSQHLFPAAQLHEKGFCGLCILAASRAS
jgi:hypothetical protein